MHLNGAQLLSALITGPATSPEDKLKLIKAVTKYSVSASRTGQRDN